jgi:uncharacterized protein with PIN domain
MLKNRRRASWMTGSPMDEEPDTLRPTQLRTNATLTQAKHGENARPRCEACKLVMRMSRREAHPALGPRYELQTYTCAKCGKREQVVVPSPGGA